MSMTHIARIAGGLALLVWFTVPGLLPPFVSLTAVGSVVSLAFVVYSNRFFQRVATA